MHLVIGQKTIVIAAESQLSNASVQERILALQAQKEEERMLLLSLKGETARFTKELRRLQADKSPVDSAWSDAFTKCQSDLINAKTRMNALDENIKKEVILLNSLLDLNNYKFSKNDFDAKGALTSSSLTAFVELSGRALSEKERNAIEARHQKNSGLMDGGFLQIPQHKASNAPAAQQSTESLKLQLAEVKQGKNASLNTASEDERSFSKPDFKGM